MTVAQDFFILPNAYLDTAASLEESHPNGRNNSARKLIYK